MFAGAKKKKKKKKETDLDMEEAAPAPSGQDDAAPAGDDLGADDLGSFDLSMMKKKKKKKVRLPQLGPEAGAGNRAVTHHHQPALGNAYAGWGAACRAGSDVPARMSSADMPAREGRMARGPHAPAVRDEVPCPPNLVGAPLVGDRLWESCLTPRPPPPNLCPRAEGCG